MLLLGVSSVNVKAAEVEIKPYHVYVKSHLCYGSTGSTSSKWQELKSFLFYPNNGTEEKITTDIFDISVNDYNSYGELWYSLTFDIANDNQTILFEKNIKTTVRLENIFTRALVNCLSQNCAGVFYTNDIKEVLFVVNYVDGTKCYFSSEFESDNHEIDVKSTFTPSKDVQSITIQSVAKVDLSKLHHNGDVPTPAITTILGEISGDDTYNLTIQQPSEEAGLLSGIWGAITDGFSALGDKITSLWTAITDGFANMGNKLTDVWNSLQELPSKLWGLIENGLKGLFVPDEEYIVEVKARIEEWAERTWGGMYQAVAILYDVWDSINDSQFQNTIEIPETTINLTDGNSFTFGGWVVPIVPEGFEFLANIVRWVVAVFATLFFINGLRKRYDRIFGG